MYLQGCGVEVVSKPGWLLLVTVRCNFIWGTSKVVWIVAKSTGLGLLKISTFTSLSHLPTARSCICIVRPSIRDKINNFPLWNQITTHQFIIYYTTLRNKLHINAVRTNCLWYIPPPRPCLSLVRLDLHRTIVCALVLCWSVLQIWTGFDLIGYDWLYSWIHGGYVATTGEVYFSCYTFSRTRVFPHVLVILGATFIPG